MPVQHIFHLQFGPLLSRIFQFSQVALDGLIKRGYVPSPDLPPIEGNNISNFTKLSRVQQLKYMVAYLKDVKKNFSKIGDAEISSAETAALIASPYSVKTPGVVKSDSLVSAKVATITRKQRVRDMATQQDNCKPDLKYR